MTASPEGPGRGAHHDGSGLHVPGDHGSSADERTGPDAPSLQNDRPAPHGRANAQPDVAADVRTGQHRDQVLEPTVVTDRHVVLDLDVVPEMDVAADVGAGKNDAPAPDDGAGPDGGVRVDEGPRAETLSVELGGKPAAHLRVGDPDDVHTTGLRLGRRPDGEATHGRAAGAFVDESRHRLPQSHRSVQRLAAGPAGADDVEVHGGDRAAVGAVDLALALLLLLLVTWTLVSAHGRVSRPEPLLLLLAAVGAAYSVGRLASRSSAAVAVVGGAAAAAVAVIVLAVPGGLSGAASAPPLGYGNANGALCALGAGGALVAGLSRNERWLRGNAFVAAAVLSAMAVATGSQAGAGVAVCLVVLGALLVVRPTAGRFVPLLAAAVVLLSLTLTAGLGWAADAQVGPRATPLHSELSQRRVTLWSESLQLLTQAPLRGVGPGRFQEESPLARADADARWSHSLWLQHAAETGVPGLVLLVAIASVVLLRVHPDGLLDGGVAAMGAAIVAGLLVHASIDYVMHFASVATLGALLAGLTAVPRRTRRRQRLRTHET